MQPASMPFVRLLTIRSFRPIRSFTTAQPRLATEPGSTKPSDHTTNSKDELDVQSAASKSGKRERIEGSHASATSEKDTRNDNERAQKENPESPIVIGMNDERGGKGH
ncbi:hypothetical protein MMC34_001807 [Xylographa carneopallida]|nr:hypothetical protein [Xylographa carneopallida]